MTNEVQRFDIIGNPNSGYFQLAFRGEWTGWIDFHPTANQVERALEDLSLLGAGNVAVTSDGVWGYVCSFQNALGDQDLPQLEANTAFGLGETVEVSTVINGVPLTGGSPPLASITIPCTLQRFNNWLLQMFVFTSGLHHDVVVGSDGATISLTRAAVRGPTPAAR
jgi:hypothetical protein